jgi:hypothetical protein
MDDAIVAGAWGLRGLPPAAMGSAVADSGVRIVDATDRRDIVAA